MYDYRRGESILGAFLFGGIVGAVLGLLFAPRSGRENREFIAAKAKDYWGEGMEFYETGREKVSEVYETGREKVSGVYETGKEKASETADELRVKIDSARDRLREQVETVSSQAKEKVVEYAPAAKETVHKVGEVVKNGVETAEVKAEGLLDMVAEKAAAKDSEPAMDLPE